MIHKRLFLLLFGLLAASASAQSIFYDSLGDLLENKGDTVQLPQELVVQRRTRNQQILSGGGDFRLSSETRALNRRVRSAYAIRVDSALYVNCRRVRYNKLRFGGYYAPALMIERTLFFCALPLGNIANRFTNDTHTLGELGYAISSSAVLKTRVYYDVHPETATVAFVDNLRMRRLLQPYDDLFTEYIRSGTEEATVVGEFLLRLKEKNKARQ